MARIYIVPSSLFVPGRINSARRYEDEIERIKRRELQIRAELATIPAKLADAEQKLEENSLERWRIE